MSGSQGQGSLVTSILKAYPTVKGIVFDIPTVIKEAKSRLQAQGFADRCTVVSGNFFESVRLLRPDYAISVLKCQQIKLRN